MLHSTYISSIQKENNPSKSNGISLKELLVIPNVVVAHEVCILYTMGLKT